MARFGDNNMSRIVSITLLNVGMPPFDMTPEVIAHYVEQVGDIPEIELRETIFEGLAIWLALPTPDAIRALWREIYAPLDPLWHEAFMSKG